ncbi:NAD-dependent epimerase/dehydratase family protein [Filimonas effusa]|uniref:NAD-dependent epimerase/dehydratase family protein n=1 Tax=Filimonas effusa TaxID=2508721 RepID=A0A4Q1DEK5_9BACT|nr:NAD-dependent epimerase/dehydratase family protein [Filimonas effusa]RXK87355.1 NAD-dependent epimerase/dehydratase family protein [Filimonas effusa]
MENKICIIGSNSFLAQRLITWYSARGAKLSLWGKYPVEGIDADFYPFNFPEKNIDFSVLETQDVIIYCAASGVQASKSYETDSVYSVNAFLPIQIINYLSARAFKGSFISFGSYFEIGNNNEDHQYTEREVILSDKAIPNYYCDSKRLLSRFFSGSKYGINWFHLILPSLYGKGENSQRLIPYVVNGLMSGEELKLSSGEQIRQYLHIDDLVGVIDAVITGKLPADVYNVASDELLMVKDIVAKIHELCNKPYSPPQGVINKADQSMRFLGISPNKLTTLLPDWRPKSIEEGIREYLT